MIAVLTPDGRISKYFLGIDYSARDLRFALIEASEGHVGSTFERKVITWCYNYDPTTGTYGLLTMRLVQAGGIAFIVAHAGVLDGHVAPRARHRSGMKKEKDVSPTLDRR